MGGVLPYMIALHRPTKSVVLAVRGTGVSVALTFFNTDVNSNPPSQVAGAAGAQHRWEKSCSSEQLREQLDNE